MHRHQCLLTDQDSASLYNSYKTELCWDAWDDGAVVSVMPSYAWAWVLRACTQNTATTGASASSGTAFHSKEHCDSHHRLSKSSDSLACHHKAGSQVSLGTGPSSEGPPKNQCRRQCASRSMLRPAKRKRTYLVTVLPQGLGQRVLNTAITTQTYVFILRFSLLGIGIYDNDGG